MQMEKNSGFPIFSSFRVGVSSIVNHHNQATSVLQHLANKLQIKLSLRLIMHYVMQTLEQAEAQLHTHS
jgi:ribosomal protein S3